MLKPDRQQNPAMEQAVGPVQMAGGVSAAQLAVQGDLRGKRDFPAQRGKSFPCLMGKELFHDGAHRLPDLGKDCLRPLAQGDQPLPPPAGEQGFRSGEPLPFHGQQIAAQLIFFQTVEMDGFTVLKLSASFLQKKAEAVFEKPADRLL